MNEKIYIQYYSWFLNMILLKDTVTGGGAVFFKVLSLRDDLSQTIQRTYGPTN